MGSRISCRTILLGRLIDGNTLAPDGGTFEPHSGVGHDANNLFFNTSTTEIDVGRAVFRSHDGIIDQIVGPGDVLEGKTVSTTAFAQRSVSGNFVAFFVHYTDETSAVYVAKPVPLPPASLPGIGLLGALGLWHAIRYRSLLARSETR